MRKIDRALNTIFLILLVLVLGFIALTSFPAQPMPQALDALKSDDQVQVTSEPGWVFRPRAQDPTIGLIIYPGALVDARAYAPTARAIASKGYLVVITPMLFNLALFGEDRARQVTPFMPKIRQWAIAGHSLGGVVATSAVHKTEGIRGLVLWGAVPAEQDDISKHNFIVTSIYGTTDKLTPPEKILDSKSRLPSSTKFIAIEGGNHAQFGWYGKQNGDSEATISREQQQEQVINATIDVLHQLERLH